MAAEAKQYKSNVTGAVVSAVQWNKDGDHAAVVRYPIERREWKGLLETERGDFALKFGDWVIADEKGRLAGVHAERFAEEFEEVELKSE